MHGNGIVSALLSVGSSVCIGVHVHMTMVEELEERIDLYRGRDHWLRADEKEDYMECLDKLSWLTEQWDDAAERIRNGEDPLEVYEELEDDSDIDISDFYEEMTDRKIDLSDCEWL